MAVVAPRPPLPIAAIAGTVGKTTVASLLDRLARGAGWRTVTWLDTGVTIDGLPQVGELLPWSQGLQQVLQRQLDLAIQELPAATVQAVGLPARAYQVAIVTNLAMNDALYQATPAALRQQAVHQALAAAVHPQGWLVLNADDLAVADLASSTEGRIALWAQHRQSPPLARHLRQGGAGLYLRDDQIVWETAGQCYQLASVTMVPLTLAGLAAFQVQNLLAALTAALVLGVSVEQLQAQLPRLDDLPGLVDRTMTLDGGIHCRVVIGRADSLPALRALARLMGRLSPGGERVVGIGAWPTGRTGEEERELARILARLFSLLFLYGAGAERAAELIAAARPADRLPTVCVPVADEVEAVRRLMARVASGDRLLLLPAQVASAVGLLASYRPIFEAGR